ncbi:MAG: site-2 protease family protein, partial [Bacilli bacterium]|nr:site-2 protease family protein [Bacilli bacterium]
MMVVLGIIVFILILGIIVLIHEGGHFFFARRAGILCYEFSIGMGPVIFQKKIGETCYSIRAIPIGGFVSMAGEEIESDPIRGFDYAKLRVNAEGMVEEIYVVKDLENKFPNEEKPEDFKKIVKYDLVGTKEEKDGELFIEVMENNEVVHYPLMKNAMIRFNKKEAFQIAPFNRLFVNKTILQRFLTIFAGPGMNFVLALLVFFIIGLCTGYSDTKTTILGTVEENTPAYVAGLQAGDKIISIGNSETFGKWDDLSSALDDYAEGKDFNGQLLVKYERDGKEYTTTINPLVYIQSAYIYFRPDGSNSLEVSAFPNNNEETPSYIAGLRDGDILYSAIDDKGVETVFTTRASVLDYFNNGRGADSTKFTLKVVRNNETISLQPITTYKKQIFEDQGVEVARVVIGISPRITRNIGRVLGEPFKEVGSSCLVIFKTLGALFQKNSGLGIKDLSG